MIRPLAFLLLAGVSSLVGGEAHRHTEKGNAAYKHGDHPQALEEYGRAQAAAPTAPQLPYDIGNVLYQQKNFAGAAEAYEKALGSAPPSLVPQINYNLGNALFRDKRYDDAVKAYVRSLKGAPGDAEAKRNLELALRALELQKQEQQKQQQKKKQDPENGKDQKKPSGESRQDQKQPPPKDDGSGDKKSPQDPKDQKKDPSREGGMSPEQAKKLLDRVAGQERDDKKKARAQQAQPGDVSREKDW